MRNHTQPFTIPIDMDKHMKSLVHLCVYIYVYVYVCIYDVCVYDVSVYYGVYVCGVGRAYHDICIELTEKS